MIGTHQTRPTTTVATVRARPLSRAWSLRRTSSTQPVMIPSIPRMNVNTAEKGEPGWGMKGTVRRHVGWARYQMGAEATIRTSPRPPTMAASAKRP